MGAADAAAAVEADALPVLAALPVFAAVPVLAAVAALEAGPSDDALADACPAPELARPLSPQPTATTSAAPIPHHRVVIAAILLRLTRTSTSASLAKNPRESTGGQAAPIGML